MQANGLSSPCPESDVNLIHDKLRAQKKEAARFRAASFKGNLAVANRLVQRIERKKRVCANIDEECLDGANSTVLWQPSIRRQEEVAVVVSVITFTIPKQHVVSFR